MPARLTSDDGRNTVIRPLAYAPEEELAEFAELMQFPIIPCDLCGSQENLQRKQMKKLLASLQEQHPNLKSSVLNALTNVRPTHLLDPKLSKDAPRSEGGTGAFEASDILAKGLAPLLSGAVKLPVLSAD
jgi:tRNA 2-thiocytidine biosynthesis protein TtcA